MTELNNGKAELIFVDTTNNKNVVLCKGEPESIYNVQHYVFKCSVCNSGSHSQAQFYNKHNFMCYSCAYQNGFIEIFHNNSSQVMMRHTKHSEGLTENKS